MPINTMKTINKYKGRMNSRYTMRISDMYAIQEASNELFDIMFYSFVFGYAQGSKATRKELTK